MSLNCQSIWKLDSPCFLCFQFSIYATTVGCGSAIGWWLCVGNSLVKDNAWQAPYLKDGAFELNHTYRYRDTHDFIWGRVWIRDSRWSIQPCHLPATTRRLLPKWVFLSFCICIGRFIYSHRSPPVVRRLVEKDSSLNQYSVEDGTVTIPHFSKSLLLQDLQVDLDVGRMNAGSCSFDLMVRLGLFPGQQNEALAEYDTKVPLDAIVSRGNCYCGRISRHGFVFLVSKYFQHQMPL